MSRWLGKKFNAPIAGPMAPFFAAGVVVLYGVSKFADVLANSEEFRNDPRNPNYHKNNNDKLADKGAQRGGS